MPHGMELRHKPGDDYQLFPFLHGGVHQIPKHRQLGARNLLDRACIIVAEKSARQLAKAQELVNELTGLFAGGEMAEEDMEEMVHAVQEAYWIAKKKNKKYTTKKYLKDGSET